MAHPVGESKMEELPVNFDCSLKLEFHSPKNISDARLFGYREQDDAHALTEVAGDFFRTSVPANTDGTA